MDEEGNEIEDEDILRTQWEANRVFVRPEVGPFHPIYPSGQPNHPLWNILGNTTLQVIVKIASIELTPEKPEFPGGSWHVEGMCVGSADASISSNADLQGRRTKEYVLQEYIILTMRYANPTRNLECILMAPI